MNMCSYTCCKSKYSVSSKTIDISTLLQLISGKSRFSILYILQNGQHCVCELMEHTHLSQSLLSHHLKDLKEADLIIDQKKGQWVHYSLTSKGKQVIKIILKLQGVL